MKFLSVLACLCLLLSFVGCGPSETERQAQAEQAEQEKAQREKEEQQQRQRQAMYDAVAYDKAVGDQVESTLTLGEIVFGRSDESIANYVRNLKRVPLDDCPEDFQRAYE